MIRFNRAIYTGKEDQYIKDAILSGKLSGDGSYTAKCSTWIENRTGINRALMTTSCTHAIELAALLTDIQPGDEVIMPSFTFVSTANAFVLRGAKVVFVDIRPDTMNMNEQMIERAVTSKTKAIVPVHYAGVGCEMDVIMDIARRKHISVIEDAAQAVTSTYKNVALGTIGDFGCYSFHETKNLSMGEGGALLIRNKKDVEQAEIIREKGTNRSKFYRGEVDKYTWVDLGSSYLPSELNAAYLFAQLEMADEIMKDRMDTWYTYWNQLKELADKEYIQLPYIPKDCIHNAHMFYIKVKDIQERTRLASFLKNCNINAVFHYIPLHSSVAGRKYGRFSGEDVYTTKESERLLRLPLYYGMKDEKYEVIERVKEFFINKY